MNGREYQSTHESLVRVCRPAGSFVDATDRLGLVGGRSWFWRVGRIR